MAAPLFNEDIIGSPTTIDDDFNWNFNPDEDDLRKQKAKRYGQDTQHRSHLITWVMIIIPVWLIAVLLIVAFVSQVSDTVKTTLLVTTTANVIGLALVVLRGMFSNDQV